jgi:signal transduction histidine kinase
LSHSLEGRLSLMTTAWTLAALVLFAFILGGFVETYARRALDARLGAMADQLANNISIASDGTVVLDRQPDEAGFQRSRSGWYWLTAKGGATVGQSRSLAGRDVSPLESVTTNLASTTFEGERIATVIRPIRGQEDQARLIVTAPLDGIDAEVGEMQKLIGWTMAALAAALIAGIILQIRLGLRPVRRLASDIERIRAGEIDTLPKPGVANLEPVTDAVNRLVSGLEKAAQRSREDASNLAHAIKTPLSMIMLRSAPGGATPDVEILTGAEQIHRHIERRLKRSRTITAAGFASVRTPLSPVIEDALLASSRVHNKPATRFDNQVAPTILAPASREDLEEIVGNIIDNAFKWASTRIAVRAWQKPGGLAILVEDDGPGIDQHRIQAVLRRGTRLDETMPGTGLGLAIVSDVVADLGGSFELSRSALGGLAATIFLPDTAAPRS